MAFVHPRSRLFNSSGEDFKLNSLNGKISVEVLGAVAPDEVDSIPVTLEPVELETELYKIGYTWGPDDSSVDYFYTIPGTYLLQSKRCISGGDISSIRQLPVNVLALFQTVFCDNFRFITITSVEKKKRKKRRLIEMRSENYTNILVDLLTVRCGPETQEEFEDSIRDSIK